MFLTYGRNVSPDELDSVQFEEGEEENLPVTSSPPKLNDFQTKVYKIR